MCRDACIDLRTEEFDRGLVEKGSVRRVNCQKLRSLWLTDDENPQGARDGTLYTRYEIRDLYEEPNGQVEWGNAKA